MALFYPILVVPLLVLYLLINVSFANSNVDVHFGYNSTSGWTDIVVSGAASKNNDILELTGAHPSSSCSWATYKESIPLVNDVTGMPASFLTHFIFFINATGVTSAGDGLAFFLAPYPLSKSASNCGGNFGLFNSANNMDTLDSSQNQVVAVEIDTYRNNWDPETSHIGIDVNSVYSVIYEKLDDTIMSGT